MELKIYNRTGEQKAIVSPLSSSQWTREVSGENVVSLSFKTWEFFMLDVNDYIKLDGYKFKIKKEYRPRQISTQEYSYQVHFYGREHDAEDIKLCRLTQGEDDLEVTFAYEATPLEMLSKLVQNLNRNTDGVTWKVGEAVDAPRQTFEFNDVFCRDALNSIAAQLETEWWVDGDYLNLCKCERGESVELGYLQGLTSLTQQENTNTVRFFTRLIPRGSTKNIDRSKYGYDRLQLPSRAKFIDLNTKLGLKEHVEEAAFTEIFPHRVGTVSAVRSEEKENEETGKFTVYYIKDNGLPFNPDDYMLGGEVIHLTFQSGNLQGKDFEVNWNYDKQEFEIINIYPDADTQLPGGNLIPAIGDTYILWNLRMPDSYIADAEREYEAAVNSFLTEYARDVSIYSGNTDYIYVDANKVPLRLGQRVRLLSSEYFGETGYRDSRMTRIVSKIENRSIATIECCNAVGRSWKSSIESSIGELKYTLAEQQKKGEVKILKTGDAEVPSEYNVFSALRALGEFISKKKDDTVRGVITFLKGIKIGKFVTGLIGGSGASIYFDPNGKTVLEADKAVFREELVVPKITFNCIDVISGDKANTFSFGTIKTVDKVRCIATLELLDDQLGTPQVNDICRGIFHNIEGNNITEDAYDGNGFLGYAGFSTSYFTPVEIIENKPGVFAFKYEIQAGTSVHPMPGMIFFAYGNFTDKQRQAVTYENRYYTRRLVKVNTWVIDPDKHIAIQDGLLEGLTVGGQEMHGYGTYQTNCYFTGVQIQFTPEQLDSLKGNDAYSVSLSDYEGVVVVDDEGDIFGGISELQNVLTGGKNVIADNRNVVLRGYRLKTQIQAFKGKTELFHSPVYKEEAYTVELNTMGCAAFVVNGVVVVSSVTDYENCYVDIAVNCEGNAVFRKTYRVTAVRNGKSPITADLDNEMYAVRCDDSGKVLDGLPATTMASMSYGTTLLAINRIVLDTPSGVTAIADAATGNITVTGITDIAAENLNIGITLYATYAGIEYHKSVSFVIMKVVPGENGMLYQLLPSVDKVSIDKTGAYSNSSLYCSVTQSNGKTLSVLSSLPSELTMKYSYDGGAEVAYTYKSNVLLNGKRQHVRFHLYYKGVLVDRETVLIVSDGVDGADGGKGDKGDKGDDGYDGDDATSYWLDSSVTQIGVNSLGSVEPSSFVVYSRAQVGEGTPYLKNWYLQIWVSNDNATWEKYGNSAYGSSITVRPVLTYKYYSIRAYSSSSLSDAYRINAVSVVLVKDGNNIASSSSPRNRQEFNNGERYYWNSKFRDIVYDTSGAVWMVNVFSETGYVTSVPSANNSEWTEGSRDIFRAMDTALIDGANIAGFMYKNQVMRSQEQDTSGNPNMELDGKRGMQKIGDFYFYGAPTMTQGIFYNMGDNRESRFGRVCIQPRSIHTVPRNALRSVNDAQLNVLVHLGRARDNELDRVLYAGGISEFNGRVVVSSFNAEHTGARPDKPALFVEGGFGMEGVFHCEPIEITSDGAVPSINGKAPYSSLFKISGSVTVNLSDSAGDLPAGSEITFITMGTSVWDLKYDKGIYTRGQGKRTMITINTPYEIWRVWFPVKGGPAYAGFLN